MSLVCFYIGLMIVSFLITFIGSMRADLSPIDAAICSIGNAVGIPLIVQYFV